MNGLFCRLPLLFYMLSCFPSFFAGRHGISCRAIDYRHFDLPGCMGDNSACYPARFGKPKGARQRDQTDRPGWTFAPPRARARNRHANGPHVVSIRAGIRPRQHFKTPGTNGAFRSRAPIETSQIRAHCSPRGRVLNGTSTSGTALNGKGDCSGGEKARGAMATYNKPLSISSALGARVSEAYLPGASPLLDRHRKHYF